MEVRPWLAGAETVGFVIGLIALVRWLNLPDVMSMWQTVGWTFAFIGVAAVQAFVFAWILLGGNRR